MDKYLLGIVILIIISILVILFARIHSKNISVEKMKDNLPEVDSFTILE